MAGTMGERIRQQVEISDEMRECTDICQRCAASCRSMATRAVQA